MRYVLPALTLVMGVTLSAIAAYYSVFGLAALFAGATMAVLILGGALEVAKLVLATVLHSYWDRLTGWMKVLGGMQLVVLMAITAMGIFGFLTAAHVEQKQESVPAMTRIAGLQTQIDAENRRIKSFQLERDSLDKISVAGASAGSVTAATKARQSLSPEYAKVDQLIQASQIRIEQLETQKIAHEREVRQTESKIGPLKYAAKALFGGDSTENTEKAVIALTLLLMFVFDPLAVSLVVVGSMLLQHAARYRFRGKSKTNDREEEVATVVVETPNVKTVKSNVTSFEDIKLQRTPKVSPTAVAVMKPHPRNVGAQRLRKPQLKTARRQRKTTAIAA